MKKKQMKETIRLCQKRIDYLHDREMELIVDSVNLHKVPRFIRWLFGANFDPKK